MSEPEASPAAEPANDEEARRREANRATWTFTWRFLAILVVVSGLLYLDDNLYDDFLIRPLTHLSAVLIEWNMLAFGLDVTREGSLLTYGGRSFTIIADCVGLEVHGLFLAAVFAVPAGLALKLKGLAMGVPVLAVVNHVRMLSLVFLGAHSMEWVDIGHLYIWPIIVIIVAIGLWLSWIRIIQDDARFLA